MAYIAPDTTIFLYKGLPFQPDYTDTLYFGNASDQQYYFRSKPRIQFDKQRYQVTSLGQMKLLGSMADLEDVNYLAWQGGILNPHWYYAFVTLVEYVNNSTVLVHYELDYVQTYFFGRGMGLKECFVEREIVHPSLDVAYSPRLTVPEGLDIGPMVAVASDREQHAYPDPQYVVATTFNISGDEVVTTPGEKISGIQSGIRYLQFGIDVAKMTEFLDKAAALGVTDGIMGVYAIDYNLLGESPYTAELVLARPSVIGSSAQGGTYKPYNNKLLNYPFVVVEGQDGTGNTYEYRPELFSTDTMKFSIFGTFNGVASKIMHPEDYKGVAGVNFNESMHSSNGCIPIAYNVDGFKAWLAQTSSSRLVSSAGSAIGGGLTGAKIGSGGGVWGAAAGALAGTLIGGGLTMAKQFMDVSNKEETTPRTGTLPQAAAIDFLDDVDGFWVRAKTITPAYAERIDLYFQMFGYQANRVKIPDIVSRPKWNYVKTVDCQFTGDCPAQAERSLKQIFDNGIRFWKKEEYVGKYDTSNK